MAKRSEHYAAVAGNPLGQHEKTFVRLLGEGKSDDEIIDLMDMRSFRFELLLTIFYETTLKKLGIDSREALRVWAQKEIASGYMEVQWRSFRFDSGEEHRIETAVRRVIRLMDREIAAEAESQEEEQVIRARVTTQLVQALKTPHRARCVAFSQ